MKGQKKNIQDKKRKLECSNTRPNSPKPKASQRIAQTSLILARQITSETLGLFSSNLPKRAQSRLSEKSLSPSPTRLNMRRKTQP